MLYFAYGMNTNPVDMAVRCPAAQNLGVASLLNHQLVFKYHADMVPSPGHIAVGVLWEITPECLESLDWCEGYPVYYSRKTVTVITRNESLQQAIMYYMLGDQSIAKPSDAYYHTVLAGYKYHNIPATYLDSALLTHDY